jgi:hypothetical protein
MLLASDRHQLTLEAAVEYVRSPFEPAEYEALSRLADRDLRPLPNEIRHIVRQALEQAGLLDPSVEHRATEVPR